MRTRLMGFCFIALLYVLASSGCLADSDLVGAARLSLHGFMVKNPKRLPGAQGFYRFYFDDIGLPVPKLSHSQWDLGDCTSRAVEEWLFVRQMTGDAGFGAEVENGQRALLLSLLDPQTGMVTVPELRNTATGDAYFQMWDQGRTLRALVRWWMAEGEPTRKEQLRAAIGKLLAGVDQLARHGTDPKCGDYAVWKGDAFVGGKPRDDMSLMRGGQLLEPLAMYWSASKDPAALRLAQQVCAGVISGHESDGYEGRLAAILRFGPDGSFIGHFHDHASIALGVAKFGAALCGSGERARGVELLRWAKRVYDWTLSPANPNAGGSFGWFPEDNTDGAHVRKVSEVCCLADMIELAAELARAAQLDPTLGDYDALWDHVERYTVNTLLLSQFRVTPAYTKLVNDYLGKRIIANGCIAFELDAQGTYDHEAMGHGTLSDKSAGHLMQTLYAVEYDGQVAAFAYRQGRTPEPVNLQVTEPTSSNGSALVSRVRTSDARLQIGCRTSLGRGPYVVREFTVKNLSDHALAAVRFACAANLDSPTWMTDVGVADPVAGRVVITSATGDETLALAGVPRPDYVRADDAMAILHSVGKFDWQPGPARMQGSAAGLVGWQLGPIGPGQEKRVQVILAVTPTPAELERAIAGEAFPGWDQPPDLVATNLRTAQRMEGGFVACAYPNDLVYTRDDGSILMSWMGCCQYSGVRGLYGAWKPIFDEAPGVLSVRLPLDRKGQLADQTVAEQKGRVVRTIRLLSSCLVEVRIPDWVEMDKVRALSGLRTGQSRVLTPRTVGRWLQFGKLDSGTELSVSYPLTERTTTERVGGNNRGDGYCDPSDKVEYGVRWCGNRVQSISPAGRLMPLFEATGKD